MPLDAPPAGLTLPGGGILYSRAALAALQPLAAADGDGTPTKTETSPEHCAPRPLRYKKKMLMWGPDGVGYCMMTFAIRNSLPALRTSEQAYLASLTSLARHTWALPEPLVAKARPADAWGTTRAQSRGGGAALAQCGRAWVLLERIGT